MRQTLAATVLLGMAILAWQVGGAVKAVIAASVARLNAENAAHDPRPVVEMPKVFSLMLPGGGTLTCRLGPTAYACMAPPVREPVKGITQ
jgi:hypothetical protein